MYQKRELRMKENITKNPLIAAARCDNLDKAVESNVSAVILMEGKLSYLIQEKFKTMNDTIFLLYFYINNQMLDIY